MLLRSFLLATALMLGAMAQNTSIVHLYLSIEDGILNNVTFQGSVISAAPDATTYSVRPVSDGKCYWDWCELEMTYVNGPSTFGRHLVGGTTVTDDVKCDVSGKYHWCNMVVAGPSVEYTGYETMTFVHTSVSRTPVTITAGLEKILAVSTATSATAQTASSASLGPSETGASASATSSSSRAGNAATELVRNIALSAFCAVFWLV